MISINKKQNEIELIITAPSSINIIMKNAVDGGEEIMKIHNAAVDVIQNELKKDCDYLEPIDYVSHINSQDGTNNLHTHIPLSITKIGSPILLYNRISEYEVDYRTALAIELRNRGHNIIITDEHKMLFELNNCDNNKFKSK